MTADLSKVVAFLDSEEFLELVVYDISVTSYLLTSLVLTTLYNHTNNHLFYSHSKNDFMKKMFLLD